MKKGFPTERGEVEIHNSFSITVDTDRRTLCEKLGRRKYIKKMSKAWPEVKEEMLLQPLGEIVFYYDERSKR